MLLQETKIRLSKAVLLRDSFTGEPVTSGVRVSSLSGGRAERKNDGYLLFLDVLGAEFEVVLDSPVYQRKRVLLKADRGEEVEEVFLYPSQAYPMRQGCTIVRGKARAGSLLRFYLEDAKKDCRLLADYKKGDGHISFYWKGGAFPPLWHIKEKQNGEGEYFLVKAGDGQEPFQLAKPLQSPYQKKSAVACPAMETAADEKGEFYLLVRGMAQETRVLHYTDGETWGAAELSSEKENILSWEG